MTPRGGEVVVHELPPEFSPMGVAGGRAWARARDGRQLLAMSREGDLQRYSLPPGGRVVALSAAAEGDIWIACSDGVVGRLAGDRFETFEVTPTLPDLDGILLDDSTL